MSAYNSSRDLAEKVAYEGGLAEMIFSYGLGLDDLPDDMPENIRVCLTHVIGVSDSYEQVQKFLYEEADKDPQPGDWDYDDDTGSEFD